MLGLIAEGLNPLTVSGQQRRRAVTWAAWIAAMTSLTGLLGLVMLFFGPTPAVIGWLIFAIGAAAILYQPSNGVYLSLFFALIGDGVLTPWYPFIKNLSSAESIFFVNNNLIVSPLEIYLGLTFLSWLGRAAMQRRLSFFRGALFWPVMVFTGCVVFGLAYGLLRGGNVNIALWEARSIFYMPVMLILVSNLIRTRRQLDVLLWIAMIAMFVVGVSGDLFFFLVLKGNLSSMNAITEHAAAVRMNTIFVFVLAAWIYKASPSKRYVIPWMTPVVLIAYFATQRRAAFLTLTIALVLIALVLFKEKRRLFWIFVPPILCAFLLYLAAFWNTTSVLGLPAQAVKSMIDTQQSSAEDQLSNIYRMIENVNASFTIHTAPLTGVGFGRKFFVIVPMPDISFFAWWEYITHNSIIWIWMKTGIVGFLVMLYLVGFSVMTGVRMLFKMPGGDLSAAALLATFYIVMHFIYAYVDMSWDIQSMLYIGTMMGIINNLERIAGQPVEQHPPKMGLAANKLLESERLYTNG